MEKNRNRSGHFNWATTSLQPTLNSCFLTPPTPLATDLLQGETHECLVMFGELSFDTNHLSSVHCKKVAREKRDFNGLVNSLVSCVLLHLKVEEKQFIVLVTLTMHIEFGYAGEQRLLLRHDPL